MTTPRARWLIFCVAAAVLLPASALAKTRSPSQLVRAATLRVTDLPEGFAITPSAETRSTCFYDVLKRLSPAELVRAPAFEQGSGGEAISSFTAVFRSAAIAKKAVIAESAPTVVSCYRKYILVAASVPKHPAKNFAGGQMSFDRVGQGTFAEHYTIDSKDSDGEDDPGYFDFVFARKDNVVIVLQAAEYLNNVDVLAEHDAIAKAFARL